LNHPVFYCIAFGAFLKKVYNYSSDRDFPPLYGTGDFISVVAALLVSTLVMPPKTPLSASFSRGKPSGEAVSPEVGLRPTALPLAHEASLPAATEILSREVAI